MANSIEQTTDQAQLIMNRLFGIELDLSRVLSQTTDGPGQECLRRAIDALDETIQDVRALAMSRLPH